MGAEQSSLHIPGIKNNDHYSPTPLSVLTRRRLYSRLLMSSSGTVLKSLDLFISRFLLLRCAVKHAQVCFRHTKLPYYINLQRSNQFILIYNTRSLFVGRRLLLLTWVMVSGPAARFVVTSLALVVRLFGGIRARAFCFLVWSLSWHFRYFRMSNQPLLLLDVVFAKPWTCGRRLEKQLPSYISFIGARLPKYQTNYLICSLLGKPEVSKTRPIRQVVDLFNYQGLSARTSRQYLEFLSYKNSLRFFYIQVPATVLIDSYSLRLVTLVYLCFFV